MKRLRYRIILKYMGGALWVLTGEFLVVAMAAFVLGEWYCIPHYLALSALLAVSGWLLLRNVPEREITAPEAMAVAALTFLAASVAGIVPFYLFGPMPLLDAWFDSMSGYTTTGFSLLDLAVAPRSLIFFRALSQWLGGIGFVLFTISILVRSAGVSSRAAITLLGNGVHEERLFPRVAIHVRVVVCTYAVLTIVGITVLLSCGAGFFDAVCFTLSGVSTGGFATDPSSAAVLGGAAVWGLFFIMLLGSVNFMLYYRAWMEGRTVKGAMGGIVGNSQLICLVVFTLLGGLFVYMSAAGEGGFQSAIFFAASALSTTGFNTSDTALLAPPSMLLLVLLMFIGGSVGSSAGGIKLFRLIHVFRGVHDFLLSHLYPKEVVRRKGVEKEEFIDILIVVILYATTVFIGALVFVACGYEPLMSLFEVTSAVSTVGLSAGIVSVGLSGGLKALMILLMWAGRVEFLPIMVWSYSIAVRAR